MLDDIIKSCRARGRPPLLIDEWVRKRNKRKCSCWQSPQINVALNIYEFRYFLK